MEQIGLRFPGAAVSRKRKQEKIDSILEWLATFHFSSRAILLQVMGLEREKDGYFKSLRESFYIKEMMYPTYHKPIIMLGDYGYVLARERHVAMLHYKRRANSINMSNIRHDLAVQSAILRSGISLEQVTPERLIEMGCSIGPFTGRVVDAMLKAKAHPELAYRAVLGLTALQKKYGKERLEKASCVAWHYNAPDRRFIDNLLRHHRENQELPLSRQSEQHSMTSPEHENLRGPGYYH